MKLTRCLLLTFLAALLTASLASAAEMAPFNQKDALQNAGYSVKDLYTGCSESFRYEVPEDGVAVLLFFKGTCGNSTKTLQQFAESRWIDHEQVNIFAVESHGCTQATVQNQLKTAAGSKAERFHPVLGNTRILFDYLHQIYPNQNSITYPLVLLISKVGDTPYIRYASSNVQDMETYSAAIEALLAERYHADGNLLYRLEESSAKVVGFTGSPTSLKIPTHIQGLPVTTISHSALRGCTSLTYLAVFPITSKLEPYAFADCTNLQRVDLGSSASELPEGLFSGCTSLEACQVEDISIIGKGAFQGCSRLQTVFYSNGILLPNLLIIRESAFDGCKNLQFTLPDSVRLLGNYAFRNSGLLSVTIPGALMSFGTGVFQNCTSLKTATLKSGLTALPQATFSGCTGLQSLSLPAGLTTIGQEALRNCTALSAVTLPETLTSLDRAAFEGCGLTSVTVPSSVSELGYGAFRDCGKLVSATLPETLTQLPESLFSGCSALTSVNLPQGLTALPPTLFESCTSLTSVEIPESVTVIGSSAFSSCSALASITLPEKLHTLSDTAFYWCESLTSVVLPASLTSMGKWSFYGCEALAAAYFRGDAPTEFGLWVFDDCRHDFTMYYTKGTRGWTDSDAYDSTDETWNNYPLAPWETIVSGSCGAAGSSVTWALDMDTGVFTISGTGAMADIPWKYHYLEDKNTYRPEWVAYRDFIHTVVVEEGVTYLGSGIFYQFPVLTSVTLPDGITGLGTRAFDGCSRLSNVTFCGDAPETVSTNVFRGCAGEFGVLYPDGASGWTSPLWNEWPATHTRVENDLLTHCAKVPAGTQAILAIYGTEGQLLGCTTAFWGDSPVLTLPLPKGADASLLQLFYLDKTGNPFRSENDLTGFVL